MKSKQINFFIIPDDKEKISDFFESNNCIILKNGVSPLDLQASFRFEKETEYQFYITNKDFIKDIVLNETPNNDSFYIDIVRSFVIEFTTGGFYAGNTQELNRGRLYYIKLYYEDGEIVQKSQSFIDWANKIFSSFQKKFLHKKQEYLGYYFSQNAEKWVITNNAQIAKSGLKLLVQ